MDLGDRRLAAVQLADTGEEPVFFRLVRDVFGVAEAPLRQPHQPRVDEREPVEEARDLLAGAGPALGRHWSGRRRRPTGDRRRSTCGLEGALQRAADIGAIPADSDLRYAVLVWVTLFDERVVVDLTQRDGLSPAAAAARLTETLLAGSL